jgi:hypothetical protein
MQRQETFTPSETAAISGLALRSIQWEINEGPVTKEPANRTRQRRLTKADLLYLVILRDFEKLFSKHAKNRSKGRPQVLAAHPQNRPPKETPSVLRLLNLQKA